MADVRIDLQDLIENPPEDLDVELKDWIDITADVVRAQTAKHMAALANNGGGYLIFGFRDDRTANSTIAYPANAYDRDAISGIVKRYLLPTFQCGVDLVTSRTGIVHPVIRVPPHGSVPICSKADGPPGKNGRPQGIRVATYYTRSPGPESVPVTTPEVAREICTVG
jgi:predicted HTH transcriptional regulator